VVRSGVGGGLWAVSQTPSTSFFNRRANPIFENPNRFGGNKTAPKGCYDLTLSGTDWHPETEAPVNREAAS
jgi:hypothetical protein